MKVLCWASMLANSRGHYTLERYQRRKRRGIELRGGKKKTKKPKKRTVADLRGRVNKTKTRKLVCSQCGKYFKDLAEINAHYSHVGHKRRQKPPKKIKFSKDYSEADIQVMEAIFNLLKNPMELRKMIREAVATARRRDPERYYR